MNGRGIHRSAFKIHHSSCYFRGQNQINGLAFSIKNIFRGQFSRIAILAAIAWTAGTINNYKSYVPGGSWGIFQHDMMAYYAYLPAAFVHGGDFEFKFMETAPENEFHIFLPVVAPKTGKTVNKVTCGMAMLMSPFYILADKYIEIWNPPGDSKRDGFSRHYRVAVMYGLVFYLLIALFLLRHVLKNHYDDITVGFTLLAIMLGTNVFYYSVHESVMSHGYSFCLFCAFIFFTDRWYASKKWTDLAILGFLAGMIFLVRPTNLLIGLFFLLFNINKLSHSKEKAILFYNKKGQFLIAFLTCLIAVSPQLLLWKINSGDWLFFSYDTRFERFFWTEPALWGGLFSYCKGWFVYTPLMFLAFFGFFFLKKKAKSWFWPLAVFSILNIYIVLSWWSWWYGGGFGLRAFAEAAAPMSFALAALIDWAKKQGLFIKIIIPVLISFCIVLNLFQTRQYHEGYIRWNGMTKERYWGIFGKYYLSKEEHEKYDNMFKEPSR